MRAMRALKPVTLAFLALAAAVPAVAQSRVLTLDAAASRVSFLLEATGHDVEGTLALRSGRIAYDAATGSASGEIVLDVKSARTGNGSRDKTMHGDVLETAKFPTAAFRPVHLVGTVAPAGASKVTLEGVFTFHGADHKLSLPATVEARDGRLKADFRFPIPFVEWGLEDPSFAFLRVAKVVNVHVVAMGSLADAAAGAR